MPARPAWDFRRSAHGVRITVATARAHGVDAASCLSGTGIDEADLRRHELQVEADQELIVTRNLLRTVGDHAGLGTETGLRYSLASMGVLGFAMLSSGTLREAIGTGLRYLRLASAFVQPRASEQQDHACVDFAADSIPHDVRPFLVERDVAALIGMIPVLFGGELPDTDLEFRTSLSPPRQDCFASRFPALQVRGCRDGHRLTYDRALLDQPLPAGNLDATALSSQHCDLLMVRRSGTAPLAATVRWHLLRAPGTLPTMHQVAADLGMTSRTLHRRLTAEGAGYRPLLDDVRHQLATQLLTTTDLPVQDIARRLGYTESTSFTHAFHRWHNCSPQSFRSAARATAEPNPTR